MRYILTAILLFISIIHVSAEKENADIYIRTSPSSYLVTLKLSVKNYGDDLSRLILVLPVPASSHFQEVTNINTYGGDMLPVYESDDKYVRFLMDGDNVLKKNQTKEWFYKFNVTLYNIETDFSKITKIYEYDKNSDIYKWYTVSDGKWVDANNKKIKKIGGALWSGSKDYLDYARKAYRYVIKNYKYIYRFGFRSLAAILNDGGGGCGEISSIYISLLRYKGIPCRHLAGFRPDGAPHVFSDFYLEKYGWIPVDTSNAIVTGHDCFGIARESPNIIILSKGNNLLLKFDETYSYRLSLFQTYAYIHLVKNGKKEIKIEHKLSSVKE